MIIGIPKETLAVENRVAVVPGTVKQLTDAGAEVHIEAGLGFSLSIEDSDYEAAGAKVLQDRNALLSNSDIIVRINKPAVEEIDCLKEGAIHISLLNPFKDHAHLDAFVNKGISAISMEMIPRTTRAQKMDVLSSQASLAGYAMVILAADRLKKILPMMMTPAGTIKASRVFVLGAGVAGLQAIATAKRLGAIVDAFDVRPDTKEQIESLGGKYLQIDIGETGETSGGYAKEMTEAQKQLQIEGQKKVIAQSDIVITTAQAMGGLRDAPRLLTTDMVKSMRPGSVIIDLAVESGGNVEGVVADQEVDINGVKLIGFNNMPGQVADNASQMFSSNLQNLVLEYWDKENKNFKLDLEDDILKGCLITHGKAIINEMTKQERAK